VRQSDQPPYQVGAAARHPHVGQDECGPVVPGGRDRIVAGGRLTDDAKIRLLLQQPGHGGADAAVVVRDDDGDLTASRDRHRSTLA
jgi:hypothetical protein